MQGSPVDCNSHKGGTSTEEAISEAFSLKKDVSFLKPDADEMCGVRWVGGFCCIVFLHFLIFAYSKGVQ